jgi:hypothetical protein
MTSAPATSPSSSELVGPEELPGGEALEDQWLSSGGRGGRRGERSSKRRKRWCLERHSNQHHKPTHPNIQHALYIRTHTPTHPHTQQTPSRTNPPHTNTHNKHPPSTHPHPQHSRTSHEYSVFHILQPCDFLEFPLEFPGLLHALCIRTHYHYLKVRERGRERERERENEEGERGREGGCSGEDKMGYSARLRVCMLVCEFGRVSIGVFNQ